MDTVTAPDHTTRRSLAGLFAELWGSTLALVRQEAELAKAEMSEKVSQVQSGIGAIAVGGAIAFAGLLFLLSAAVAAVAQILPPDVAAWLAPLMVGIIVLLIGLIAVSKGRKDLRAGNLKPTRTAQSLRRDAQLAKEHMR